MTGATRPSGEEPEPGAALEPADRTTAGLETLHLLVS